MNRIKVLHTNGEIEDFKPRLIGQTIIKETGIDEEKANRIQSRITSKINKLKKDGLTEISTGTIRAEVSSQLLKEREFEAEGKNRKLGMSMQEFEDLMAYGCKDNANISYSPEMIAKYAYDSIAKEYALLDMPKECAEYHINGITHEHDCEYRNTRPNCMNYDLRFIAKNGLKIDGKGLMGSVAGPAKSLEVLLNHLLQAWMAGAAVLSGGQGLLNFNTLLAPFAKNRDYKSIKQAIQGFIFNCNMSLICRGSQILFSSISLDLSIPDLLKNKPAIGPNGVVNGVYGDYQQEADMIFKAVCEVLDEKDFNGAYHRFPNCVFNIREGDLDKYEGNAKLLSELGANNPTIYYVNNTGLERTVMGALSSDTPVMTMNGSKYPQELKIGDKVMTFDEDTNEKSWQKIEDIIPKSVPKEIFEITLDNNYTLKVTENHNFPTSNGKVASQDLEVGMELYNYIDEPYNPTDDYEYEFIGIFLADGYIRDESRAEKNSNVIEFHLKQKWKIDKIIEICEKCNYNYELLDKRDGTYSLNVKELELRNKLNKYYNENGEKSFPTDIWNDKNKVANVIKGLMFDAHKAKNHWVWSCSDLPLVNNVCFALSYIGRKNKIYVDRRTGKGKTKWRPNYMVTFGKNYTPLKKTTIKEIKKVKNEDMVYDLTIDNNHNYVCGLGGVHSFNCRTALPMNFTGDYEKDCCNTGNFMYTTLNLPLIALNANGDEEEFYKQLDKACEVAYKGLIHRRETVIDAVYNKHMSDFLLQKDKDTGEPLWDIDRTTITIGFCGLNECLYALYGIKISEDTEDKGVEIINFLNDKKEEFHKRDGLRWSVIASAAESTAHRFAEIIKEKYPDAYVQGTPGNYYLTNSSHIPVCEESNIIEHIKNADKYHPITTAGNILHIWLGEVWSDPKALWKLNQKIIKTGTVFWAYSKVFTYCNECGFSLNDNLDECPICKSKDVTTYDRVTGYYLPTNGYNNGKKQEFKDRYRHKNLV